MSLLKKIAAVAAATILASIGLAAAAQAQGISDWGLGLQEAATPGQRELVWFHNVLLLPIITAITLFVLALMVYVIFRFRASRNPVPSKTTHHTWLEVAWTVLPVVILAVIAIPSLRILYFLDKAEEPDMTIKVTGHQWYWSYEYPDHGGFGFDAYMVPEDQLGPNDVRMLSTDNKVVLPVGATVRVLVTADDVLHAWALAQFGVKTDAVPGRVNETWVQIERPGTYFGMCSEICGTNHAYMPIEVVAVPPEEFQAWATRMQAAKAGTTTVAQNAAAPAANTGADQ